MHAFKILHVTELSTGTDLEKLRRRAQNQELWRKGVNAIIEDYTRKWIERENKRTRYNPEAASQGGGRQAVARRGPGRPRGRQQLQGQLFTVLVLVYMRIHSYIHTDTCSSISSISA